MLAQAEFDQAGAFLPSVQAQLSNRIGRVVPARSALGEA
jgi:hypothetical protein